MVTMYRPTNYFPTDLSTPFYSCWWLEIYFALNPYYNQLFFFFFFCEEKNHHSRTGSRNRFLPRANQTGQRPVCKHIPQQCASEQTIQLQQVQLECHQLIWCSLWLLQCDALLKKGNINSLYFWFYWRSKLLLRRSNHVKLIRITY